MSRPIESTPPLPNDVFDEILIETYREREPPTEEEIEAYIKSRANYEFLNASLMKNIRAEY